jgi:hypothetical protein
MMRRPSLMLLCLFSVTLCSLVFLSGCAKKPSFNTPYQLVLLDNGQAYFGKIESLNTFVLLTDIYYVQTQVSPDGKTVVGNVLLKRGKEWHGPDRMHVNTRHVVMIEPVAPDSKVAQLIKEEKEKPAEPKK